MKKKIISIMVAVMSFTSVMFAQESYNQWLRDNNLKPETAAQEAEFKRNYNNYIRQSYLFSVNLEIANVQQQLQEVKNQSQPDDDSQEQIAALRERLRDLEAEKRRLENLLQ